MPQNPVSVQISNAAATGSMWFVGEGYSGSGRLPTSPLGTIQAAVDAADQGDNILILPGTYGETVTITTPGVSLIGATQSGYMRPDLAPDAGGALIVNAQGIYVRHMRFASDDSDTVLHRGNGATYVDCVFDGSSGQAATEANLRLVGGLGDDSYSASENRFVDCLFRGSNGFGVAFQHALAADGGEGTTDNQFWGCTFVDNDVSDLKSLVNTNGGGAGIYIRLLVRDCNFMTVGAAYKYIDFSAGAVGDLAANTCLITGGRFADAALTGGTGNQIDLGGQPGAMFVGNYDAIGLVDGSAFNA